MPFCQDISLSQKSTREDYVEYWKNDDFQSAYDIIENGGVEDQAVQKELFNSILQADSEFDWNLTDLQTKVLDEYEHFKIDRIKVSSTAPAGMTTGQVYFQIQ